MARSRVDAVLGHWGARAEEWWPGRVAAAVRYSLLSAGKRLRPTLVFASYEALGGTASGIAELAAAVEVVHAYSLVHDDLPCMDDDDLRRGRPTTHRAFDVVTATRAGYHMVALAARVLAGGPPDPRPPPHPAPLTPPHLFRPPVAGRLVRRGAL